LLAWVLGFAYLLLTVWIWRAPGPARRMPGRAECVRRQIDPLPAAGVRERRPLGRHSPGVKPPGDDPGTCGDLTARVRRNYSGTQVEGRWGLPRDPDRVRKNHDQPAAQAA
jgi:hypothetical protein